MRAGIDYGGVDAEIAAYEQMRDDLESHHMGEWIVVHNAQFIGAYDSFEVAANEAVTKFGRGPYLIRQVGVSTITLPPSVMFGRLQHGSD